MSMFQKILNTCSVNCDITHWCASRDDGEDIIKKVMLKNKINTAIEIGTHYGVTSLVMSQFADKVITLDCIDYEPRQKIWDQMGIKNIEFYLINNETKTKILTELNFDFAFIDGGHKEDVILDYELCKKCGNILFHDYSEGDYICIKNIVDSLPKNEVEFYDGKNSMFAHWEKHEQNNSDNITL